MVRHRQRKKNTWHVEADAEFSNFHPLILHLRNELGADWMFYAEFLEGVREAIRQSEDTFAWIEHIEPLFAGREGLGIAHQGIVFLLLGEVEVKAHHEGQLSLSPSRATDTLFIAPPTNSIGSPPIPPNRPSPQLPCTTDMDRNYQTERAPLPPFGQRPALPAARPAVQFPPQWHTFTAATPEEKHNNDKKSSAHDPVFFTDPGFHRAIQAFFGIKEQESSIRKADKNTAASHEPTELLPPPYHAEDDDLEVWKRLIEDELPVMSSKTPENYEQAEKVSSAAGKGRSSRGKN